MIDWQCARLCRRGCDNSVHSRVRSPHVSSQQSVGAEAAGSCLRLWSLSTCPMPHWRHVATSNKSSKYLKNPLKRNAGAAHATTHGHAISDIHAPCRAPLGMARVGGAGGRRHAGAAQSGCPHTATLDGVREARSHSQSQSRLCGTAARAMPMRIEPRPIAFAVQFGFSAWCVTLTVR